MVTWATLPLRVRVYISTVVIAAIPLFCVALKNVVSRDVDFQWLILTAITLVTVPIFVYLPSVRSLVTIGDAFVISICMLYGASSAILANTLYMSYLTLLLRRRHNTPLHRITFNIATAILNVGLYGWVFETLKFTFGTQFGDILIPTFGLAISFFLSNSLFVAGAIALTSDESILKVWSANYPRLSLDFLLSACAGAFIVLFEPFGRIAPLLVAPFVGAIWGINKVNRAKAIDAESHLREQEQLYLRTVESLAMAVDAKDQTTYGHIRRVKAYAMELAKLCGVTDKNELMAIETGSLLHDIGKLAIDDYILNKPGKLTKQEFEKMKLHAAAGDEILQQIRFPFPVAKVVRHHHERWDGQGYPDGLKGDLIPLGARVLAIADAYDAIRSSRPYKASFGQEDAVELLRAKSGITFDPALVGLFTAHIDELQKAATAAVESIPQLSFRKFFETVNHALSAASTAEIADPLPHSATSELLALFEFCNGAGRQLELPELFAVLSRRIEKLVPYTTCAFFITSDIDSVRIAHAAGKHSQELLGYKIELGKGISGWVAAYKRPMLNTSPVLEFRELHEQFATLSDAVVVPIEFENLCLGTISLYAENSNSYSQTHITLLQAVSGLLAPIVGEKLAPEQSEQSLIDPITKTYRIGYLSVIGPQMISQAQVSEAPVSLLLIEIRGLPAVMGLYGVASAETLLSQVAGTLRSELRETDVLVRFGQQGFVALLPGVRAEQVSRFLKRLRQLITTGAASITKGNPGLLNFQAGAASYPADGTSVFQLLQCAQQVISEKYLASAEAADADSNIVEFPPRA